MRRVMFDVAIAELFHHMKNKTNIDQRHQMAGKDTIVRRDFEAIGID
jgi:hypothetical protein